MVKNPLCNAGDVDLIASQRSKTLQIAEELSPRTTTTEPTHSGDHTAQLGSPCNTRKIPYVTNKTQHSQINKLIFKKRKKKIVCCSLVMFIALMFGFYIDGENLLAHISVCDSLLKHKKSSIFKTNCDG